MIHKPGKTNSCDYGSRHPTPPRSYTKQEKQDLGVEDAEIQVGRVLEELSGWTTKVSWVDTEAPPHAITGGGEAGHQKRPNPEQPGKGSTDGAGQEGAAQGSLHTGAGLAELCPRDNG